jgi:magnesium-transporting ATPase (P-type)
MVMITGDYGLTAESLARRVGMLDTNTPRIITGAELDGLEDIELEYLLEEEVIFARMAPEHKLRLVAAFQERGEVVAVTGDGVNDAPALRRADVGVAMGIVGTDVAKESADVVITNDNFAAITNAIEEGRAVYDNLRKFITYIFSSNVPEILPFILHALVRDIPLALTVAQMLAIDLGTDLFPALALGAEKPEPDVMRRPPRRRFQPLIDAGLLRRAFLWLGTIEAILCYTGFFAIELLGASPEMQRLMAQWQVFPDAMRLSHADYHVLAITVFFAGVVATQVGNAFACRTERNRGRSLGWLSNKYLNLGVLIEIFIALALIYVPPFAELFNHLPIPPIFWPAFIAYALVLYTCDWLSKGLFRRMKVRQK